jgi:uncharacterized membrane protein YccF (DUF307 family)
MVMKLLVNLLWIILGGGIFIFLGYVVGGVVLCLTIVGIPFGVQLFKLSTLGLMPFGYEIVDRGGSSGFLPLVMNIIWIIFGGIEIALFHFVLAIILFVTIIGIPFARQHIKLAALALVPFGKQVVPSGWDAGGRQA